MAEISSRIIGVRRRFLGFIGFTELRREEEEGIEVLKKVWVVVPSPGCLFGCVWVLIGKER